MSVKIVKAAAFVLCGALTLSTGSALAQEAKSLDELLKFVIAHFRHSQDMLCRPWYTAVFMPIQRV